MTKIRKKILEELLLQLDLLEFHSTPVTGMVEKLKLKKAEYIKNHYLSGYDTKIEQMPQDYLFGPKYRIKISKKK